MAIDLEKKFKELAKPAPKLGGADTNKPYWTIDQFRGRMDDVFGPSGYSMKYEMLPPYEFPVYLQVLMTCTCTIDIYDEGKVIYSTMGMGCKEIKRLAKEYKHSYKDSNNKWVNENKTRPEEERYFTELNNSAYVLQLNAFKNACKSMNIFGCNKDEDAGGEDGSDINSSYYPKNQSNNKGSSNANRNKQGSSDDYGEPIEFYVNANLVVAKEDKGEPVYELKAYRMVNSSQCEDKASTLVFYPNRYSHYRNELDKLLNLDSSFNYRVVFHVKDGRQGGYVCFGIGGFNRCGKR